MITGSGTVVALIFIAVAPTKSSGKSRCASAVVAAFFHDRELMRLFTAFSKQVQNCSTG